VTDYLLLLADALRDELLSSADVTGAVGTRIMPHGTGNNPSYEYITYALPIGDTPHHGIGFNESAYDVVRFQVDNWATTWTAAAQTNGYIRECLEGATVGVTGWGIPRFEGEGRNIQDEEIEGVRVFRGISRFKAVLAGTNVS